MRLKHVLAPCAALALTTPLAAQDAGGMAEIPAEHVGMAMLADRDGQQAGEVHIYRTADGLLFRVAATGLSEGWHGFHVHETADCSGDFSAAGGHYAPDGADHGFLSDNVPHPGDLPNVYADAQGRVMADLQSTRLSVDGDEAPLFDDDGSAIMVHAQADNYQDVSSAGDRMLCGEIEQAS